MLPNNPKMVWPPKEMRTLSDQMRIHSAWYSGDMQELANIYHAYLAVPGGRQNMFWARETRAERRTMVHLPIASDIASKSAALLFGEAPKVNVTDPSGNSESEQAKKAQARLETIIDKGLVKAKLIEAADSASGLGGVYLKVNWDVALAPYPIVSIVQQDAAIPVFQWGILTGCIFWREVFRDENNAIVWRLLESHTAGLIETALYQGSDTLIGDRRNLDVREETAGISDVVQTQLPGLACVYIPNAKPNRKFRSSELGQSDYAGVESMMDSLDETYTSLMRDIRLGQAKVHMPEDMMEKDSDGKLVADVDKELYVLLSRSGATGDTMANQIVMTQGLIRTVEHLATAVDLFQRIVTSAGYSPQSFGIGIEGMAQSGTALTIRERASFITTSKKANYWKPAIEAILSMLLTVDRIHLGNRDTPHGLTVQVEMQDSIRADVTEIAPSIDLLSRAGKISIEASVAMLHPDWNQEQKQQEVDRILAQTGLAVPDAMQIGLA